jgi:hypothetical protein
VKDPDFDTAHREARRAAFRQSVARLQQASGAAVTTLLKLMIDLTTPPSTRARAADSVLDHSAKAIELEDIEARVLELERVAETAKHHSQR